MRCAGRKVSLKPFSAFPEHNLAIMDTLITNDVRVSVETFFQPRYSNPEREEFVFAYRITIENLNPFTIQLLRRHWIIFDANSDYREVEGEGVVGQQPILEPGGVHQYVSWSNLKCEIGSMRGTYSFVRFDTDEHFQVDIPVFRLIAPHRLN